MTAGAKCMFETGREGESGRGIAVVGGAFGFVFLALPKHEEVCLCPIDHEQGNDRHDRRNRTDLINRKQTEKLFRQHNIRKWYRLNKWRSDTLMERQSWR
jgi:hypothetical protein